MHHDANVIGPSIAKLRYQRGWRQDELVAKLQLLGCYMTRDILANIETRRSPVTDTQIEFFCAVFEVEVQELFPSRPKVNGNGDGRALALAVRIVTRRRNQSESSKVLA